MIPRHWLASLVLAQHAHHPCPVGHVAKHEILLLGQCPPVCGALAYKRAQVRVRCISCKVSPTEGHVVVGKRACHEVVELPQYRPASVFWVQQAVECHCYTWVAHYGDDAVSASYREAYLVRACVLLCHSVRRQGRSLLHLYGHAQSGLLAHISVEPVQLCLHLLRAHLSPACYWVGEFWSGQHPVWRVFCASVLYPHTVYDSQAAGVVGAHKVVEVLQSHILVTARDASVRHAQQATQRVVSLTLSALCCLDGVAQLTALSVQVVVHLFCGRVSPAAQGYEEVVAPELVIHVLLCRQSAASLLLQAVPAHRAYRLPEVISVVCVLVVLYAPVGSFREVLFLLDECRQTAVVFCHVCPEVSGSPCQLFLRLPPSPAVLLCILLDEGSGAVPVVQLVLVELCFGLQPVFVWMLLDAVYLCLYLLHTSLDSGFRTQRACLASCYARQLSKQLRAFLLQFCGGLVYLFRKRLLSLLLHRGAYGHVSVTLYTVFGDEIPGQLKTLAFLEVFDSAY